MIEKHKNNKRMVVYGRLNQNYNNNDNNIKCEI